MSSNQKAPSTQSQHLDFLDGIRGAAAFYVLLGHCMIWGCRRDLLPDPKIAVAVFMVMSGYLMVYLSTIRSQTEPPGSWTMAKKFWVRRFFRIAPLYYLVLVVAFVFFVRLKVGFVTLASANPEQWAGFFEHLESYGPIQRSLANFLMHVSFLFGVFPSYTVTSMLPDWSIGLEMQFYAVFPLLFFLFVRLGPCAGATLIWIATTALKRLTDWYFAPQGFPEPAFLPLELQVFLVGMLLASAHQHLAVKRQHAYLQFVLALAFASKLPSYISSYVMGLVIIVFFMLPGVAKVEPAVAWLRGLLGNRISRFMADTSYGVYLIHGFFISFVGGWFYRGPAVGAVGSATRLVLLTVITIVGAYSVSMVLYHYVERPGIELGRRLLARKPVLLPKPITAINPASFKAADL
jgi:peptidoglycan/LPS O-acetylase OafA/YrhL